MVIWKTKNGFDILHAIILLVKIIKKIVMDRFLCSHLSFLATKISEREFEVFGLEK